MRGGRAAGGGRAAAFFGLRGRAKCSAIQRILFIEFDLVFFIEFDLVFFSSGVILFYRVRLNFFCIEFDFVLSRSVKFFFNEELELWQCRKKKH